MAEETKQAEAAKSPVAAPVVKRVVRVMRAEDFAEGDDVIHIPNHAKGDVNHEDVQEGRVTGSNGPSQLVFVEFQPGMQHTVCYPQNLEKGKRPQANAVAKP
jgi:hypothetical protein